MTITLTDLPGEILSKIFGYHFSSFEKPLDLSRRLLRPHPNGSNRDLNDVFEEKRNLEDFLDPLYDDASNCDNQSPGDQCKGSGWLPCPNVAQIHGSCWPCHMSRRTPLLYVNKWIGLWARHALLANTTFEVSDATGFLLLVRSVHAWGDKCSLRRLHFSIKFVDPTDEFADFLEVISPDALVKTFPGLTSVTFDYCPEYRRYGVGLSLPEWADSHEQDRLLRLQDTLEGLVSSLSMLKRIRVVGLLSWEIAQWLEMCLMGEEWDDDIDFSGAILAAEAAFGEAKYDLYWNLLQ